MVAIKYIAALMGVVGTAMASAFPPACTPSEKGLAIGEPKEETRIPLDCKDIRDVPGGNGDLQYTCRSEGDTSLYEADIIARKQNGVLQKKSIIFENHVDANKIYQVDNSYYLLKGKNRCSVTGAAASTYGSFDPQGVAVYDQRQ